MQGEGECIFLKALPPWLEKLRLGICIEKVVKPVYAPFAQVFVKQNANTRIHPQLSPAGDKSSGQNDAVVHVRFPTVKFIGYLALPATGSLPRLPLRFLWCPDEFVLHSESELETWVSMSRGHYTFDVRPYASWRENSIFPQYYLFIFLDVPPKIRCNNWWANF